MTPTHTNPRRAVFPLCGKIAESFSIAWKNSEIVFHTVEKRPPHLWLLPLLPHIFINRTDKMGPQMPHIFDHRSLKKYDPDQTGFNDQYLS